MEMTKEELQKTAERKPLSTPVPTTAAIMQLLQASAAASTAVKTHVVAQTTPAIPEEPTPEPSTDSQEFKPVSQNQGRTEKPAKATASKKLAVNVETPNRFDALAMETDISPKSTSKIPPVILWAADK